MCSKFSWGPQSTDPAWSDSEEKTIEKCEHHLGPQHHEIQHQIDPHYYRCVLGGCSLGVVAVGMAALGLCLHCLPCEALYRIYSSIQPIFN